MNFAQITKRKSTAVLIAALLIAGCLPGCKNSGVTASPSPSPTADASPDVQIPQGDDLVQDFVKFEDKGQVLSAKLNGDEAYIVAEGFFGYHMDENPSITTGVTISNIGEIVSVVKIAMKNQTEDIGDLVTDDYLAEAYAGKPAVSTLEVDAASGATLSSKAAMYSVQTAANYAANVYGFVAETGSADIEDLSKAYPADYTAITTDYKADAEKFGTVLFAAEGKTDDGKDVIAMKVESSKALDYTGANALGVESAEPGPYTMIIVVDCATNRVAAWQVLVDGTSKPDYFTVPDELIDTYKTVDITAENAFDKFTGGLVFGMDYTIEDRAEYGGSVITGTSIVYTGATESGTYSSQLVRLCFETAARFYCNYK